MHARYDCSVMSMKPRRRSFGQRIKDHLFFSVVVMTGIFVVLSILGVKARFASLVISIALTLALNVGLSYYYDYRAQREWDARRAGTAPRPRDTDIRFRD